MARPVQYNVHPKGPEMPEGHYGEGFFAGKLSDVVGLARKNSIWPLPFATSCCGIEFMATAASHYDLARFGSERMGFTPRQCDLLMVMGTIAKKNGPGSETGLPTDGRTPLGTRYGRMRLLWRHIRFLLGAPGHRPDHTCRRIHPRLPSTS